MAAHLRLSLAEVLAMPAPEFAAWMAYYAVEPWGVVDQFLASWGKDAPPVEDFDAAKAALKGWADG